MRRIHAIEIHEQTWCPASLRDAATDYLQFTMNIANLYGGIVERLAAALRSNGSRKILDLCSGGGGPWFVLRRPLADALGEPLAVRLTDLHPNRDAFARAERADAEISSESRPVSATAVPGDLSGFRTMFAAFHHFRPDTARAILADAAHQGRGIAIFEPLERSAMGLFSILFAPLICLLTTPFVRPFRWSRLFWAYVVPLLPLIILFDGIVSCLRTYTPEELRGLVAELDAADYTWDIGTEPVRISPTGVTYLIGTSARAA